MPLCIGACGRVCPLAFVAWSTQHNNPPTLSTADAVELAALLLLVVRITEQVRLLSSPDMLMSKSDVGPAVSTTLALAPAMIKGALLEHDTS